MQRPLWITAFILAAAGTLTLAPISFADAVTIDYTLVSNATGQTWTWTLSQNPVPDVVFPGAFEFLSVPVSLNGAIAIPYFFEFTETGAPGGGGYMSFECQPFLACSWDFIEGLNFGATLFSGSTADPTLLTGTYTSTIQFPETFPGGYPTLTATITPEPGTATLFLTGIVLMILSRKRLAQLLRLNSGTHGSLSPH